MKFADRLKFTTTGTSSATITFGAAVTGFLTLAQSIADGASRSDPLAIKVGDTGVPFTIDDGAGNEETSLFTITSTTVLTRTSVIFSSAGGTTPVTFTGAVLNVYSAMPATFASRLILASVDTLGNFVGLKDPKGNDISLIARFLANANQPAVPAVEKSIKVITRHRITDITTTSFPVRRVYAASKRKYLKFKNPASNTASFELGYRQADNIANGNSNWPTPAIIIAPGQQVTLFFEDSQWWARQTTSTLIVDQFLTIEREERV